MSGRHLTARNPCCALIQSQTPLRVVRAPLQSSIPRPFGAPPDPGGFPPERSWAKTGCSHMVESPPSRASRSPFRKTRIQEHEMGKGDHKTAKGKRYTSSYGNPRTHVTTKPPDEASDPVATQAATRTTTTTTK